jgi:NADPH-dependent curcumin reductase CurA
MNPPGDAAATIQAVVLQRRPARADETDILRCEPRPRPLAGPGELLIRLRHLSVDPYLLRLIHGEARYAGQLLPGQALFSRAIGEVIDAGSGTFPRGSLVLTVAPWQEIAAVDATGCSAIAETDLPPTCHLGVLGASGVTAWVGMMEVARPVAGETVVVSAAAGAVGGIAGQLAKAAGCRVVGIAGGAAKGAHVTGVLGFDACIDHRADSFESALAEASPQGVDIDFENVGGAVMDAVLGRLNRHARVALCGLVSQYGRSAPMVLAHFPRLLEHAVRLQGFGVSDYVEQRPRIIEALRARLRDGRLLHRETVTHGLQHAPAAVAAIAGGSHVGKQIVTL